VVVRPLPGPPGTDRPRRRRIKRPGAATLGWALVALSSYLVFGGAGLALGAGGRQPASPAGVLVLLAVGFALFVLAWRMARERRPVGPAVWASRLLNIPGLVDSFRSSRPVRRGPSAMRDPDRAVAESRSAALGIASGLAWLGAGIAAVRTEIKWFPPLSSLLFLATGTAVTTLLAAAAPSLLARRGWASFRYASVAAAVVIPLVAVAVVPPFGPLRTTPLPGREDYVATAWRDGSPQLYLVRDGGTEIDQLTFDGTSSGGADLSPDGRSVVFGDTRAGSLDLWLMSLDASGRADGLRRLTDEPGDEGWPDWSPDGRTVLYEADENDAMNIDVLDVASGSSHPITVDGRSFTGSWSPDGSSIVYASSAAASETYDIWMVRADGSDAHPILDSGGNDLDPRLSPDGERVLFSSDRTGNYDVWVARVDGSGERSLTPRERATDRALGWSPDGRFAFFTSNRSDTGGNFVFFVAAGGGRPNLAVVI
jgi:Tol biopolymer transport system component